MIKKRTQEDIRKKKKKKKKKKQKIEDKSSYRAIG